MASSAQVMTGDIEIGKLEGLLVCQTDVFLVINEKDIVHGIHLSQAFSRMISKQAPRSVLQADTLPFISRRMRSLMARPRPRP